MNEATDAALAAQGWVLRLNAAAPAAALTEVLPDDAAASLAALAAEALARSRRLLIVTPDDSLLADVSNALDLTLRPLCLVLPGADYASRIALRATLSLLRSRLARQAEDSAGPAWREQRARIEADSALWQAWLDWSARGNEREPWPGDLGRLFPVRILPHELSVDTFAADADWVVVVASAGGAVTTWPGAVATLWLRKPTSGPTALAAFDETARLRAEIELLSQELAELELELATVQAEISAFSGRYHAVVGRLMVEFDAVRAELARRRAAAHPDDPPRQQEAAAAEARAERSRQEYQRHADAQRGGTAPEAEPTFAPTTDVKKLYRQIAQKIHPDRARDEADREWRTELMAEANRAYRSGDEAALHEILALWNEGPGAGTASTREGASSALALQVAQLRRRIGDIEAELNSLYGSRLYELFAAANLARRQGRDILVEMAGQLQAQIDAARAELG